MKSFILKIPIFITSLISLLSMIYWANIGKVSTKAGILFSTKKEYFSNFIDNNDRINLILGSSLVKGSIIPDSIGPRWFSFTNPGQSIYDSFKLLDFYKDKVKIDTILIGIQPFDFPRSFAKRSSMGGVTGHPYFYIFGKDSITMIAKKKNQIRDIQLIKDKMFFNFEDLIFKLKISSIEKYNERLVDNIYRKILQRPVDHEGLQYYSEQIKKKRMTINDLIVILQNSDEYKLLQKKSFGFSKQGYSGNRPEERFTKIINNKSYLKYFINVKKPPNLYYFELFNSLAISYGIKVIYIITPKHKYYHTGMIEKGYDKIWTNIIDSIKVKPVELWDYEKMQTDSLDFQFFRDESHLVYESANYFTEVIRKRLYDTSN